MAQPPAVVIIARHGPRLDAADLSWHLSTPTPYDPPLTYGGWNQCRSLGVRIATLLHAREQAANEAASEPTGSDGVTAHDFTQQDGQQWRRHGISEQNPRKRKRKHKVVIHTSPFLRCVQSSVAIAAGMAQFHPSSSEPGSRPSTSSRSRTSNSLYSSSPRLRGMDGLGSPTIAPTTEPREDLAHAIARRVLSEHRRHSRFKLRVDAFLGEWLNPQYFDQITPPPPSPMMVATAKAELMENEMVDIFTPSLSTKSSRGNLWAGASGQKSGSKDDAVEDWSEVQETLAAPTPRRDRASSVSSVGSNDSGSGRRSPFRPGHVLQLFTSTVPKPETTVYVPPIPHYAVSSSDHIPRGYVSHARQACINADYQWDSSRPPQDWGEGGEYEEEWSAMHKRFRRGLNHLIHWYSQHSADDRAEDALGIEQAEHHCYDEEEEEELVVVLVTHGAGSNALIGALTGQPVLLDVGMASLTMAIRRDDAPVMEPRRSSDHDGLTNGHARRLSVDMGLSSIYEMKLVSSSEHLRPGADTRPAPSASDQRSGLGVAHQQHHRNRLGGSTQTTAVSSLESNWNLNEPVRSRTGTSGGTNSALGSMRRPFAAVISAQPGGVARINTTPAAPQTIAAHGPTMPSPSIPAGLWTPPAARTPLLQAERMKEERANIFSALDESDGKVSPGRDMVLDFSTSPPDSRPTSSGGSVSKAGGTAAVVEPRRTNALAVALNGGLDGTSGAAPSVRPPSAYQQANGKNDTPQQREPSNVDRNSISSVSAATPPSPQAIGRTLSQRGLWGAKPVGDTVARAFGQEPKRRWTVTQEEG